MQAPSYKMNKWNKKGDFPGSAVSMLKISFQNCPQ